MSEVIFPAGAALVIGGSGGIGSSICREFARAGSGVALTYLSRAQEAGEIAGEVRALGRSASAHQLDAGDVSALQAVVAAAAQTHGRIHTLVFSAAAVTEQVYVSEISPGQWQRALNGVAREEGRYNIRANSVLVGVIDAGMHLELKRRGVLDEQWTKNTLNAVPLRRIGKAVDIAHAAVFLASDRANYVTGQQIAVAGGFGV